MTDETTTPVPGAESHAEPLPSVSEGESAGIVPDEPQKGNREARYRVERNQAREALEAAEARIEAMNRREITRLASEHLSVGEDLFVNGNDVSAYLTDEGEIDAELVAEDAQLLLSERPGLRRNSPVFDPSQGTGGAPWAKRGPSSWADLLKD